MAESVCRFQFHCVFSSRILSRWLSVFSASLRCSSGLLQRQLSVFTTTSPSFSASVCRFQSSASTSSVRLSSAHAGHSMQSGGCRGLASTITSGRRLREHGHGVTWDAERLRTERRESWNGSSERLDRCPSTTVHQHDISVTSCQNHDFRLERKKPSCRYGSRPYRLRPKASVRFTVAKRMRFPRVTAVSYTPWWRYIVSNATINAKIRYGNSAHMRAGCRQKLCIQNCGQTAADRDMVTIEIP